MNFGSGHVYLYDEEGSGSSDGELEPAKPPRIAVTGETQKEDGSSEAAAATATPPNLPSPPSKGILKKKKKKKNGGGQMVKWMSMQLGDHKYTLRKYQPSFVELIHLPDLIPYLNSHDLLDDQMNQLLLNSAVPHKERVLHLVSYIGTKTPLDYLTFLEALDAEPDHDGHERLVRMITRAASTVEEEEPARPRLSRGQAAPRQSDTNVLAVKFDSLVGPSDVHTGDPKACSNGACAAVLSHLSVLSEGHSVWSCEFCGTRNAVELAPEEVPLLEDTTFLKSPAPIAHREGSEVTVGLEDSMVVFCIDISGSMCQTIEVAGQVEFKGHDRLRRMSMELEADIKHQYLPGQRRNVTYVSRLQSVQAAVDGQLTNLARTQPTKRVALVTFNDEVRVIGDGRSEEEVVAGDKLSNMDRLMAIAGSLSLPTNVRRSNRGLSKKVFELEEKGQTALGPALLLSVLLAGQVPGSKVIICTDGLANKGVGSLDALQSDDALAEGREFYNDLGDIALSRGVTVSLVTIKGTQCRILELGRVAERTGGKVMPVDPTSLDKEFGNILANPVIATAVTAKIVLHSRLFFRADDVHTSFLSVPVGNVTPDTELSFEYGVRSKSDAGQHLPPLMVRGRPHLPFQLQVEYTAVDGARYLRIISRAQPVTEDRTVAEKDLDFGVIGSHALRTSASLASEGRITEARVSSNECERILRRSSEQQPENKPKFKKVMDSLAPLQRSLSRHEASLPRRSASSTVSEPGLPRPHPPRVSSLAATYSTAESEGLFERHSSRSTMPLPPSGFSQSRHSSSLGFATELTQMQKTASLSGQREIEDSMAVDLFHRMNTSSSSIMNMPPPPPPPAPGPGLPPPLRPDPEHPPHHPRLARGRMSEPELLSQRSHPLPHPPQMPRPPFQIPIPEQPSQDKDNGDSDHVTDV